jgi:hypothetical protein
VGIQRGGAQDGKGKVEKLGSESGSDDDMAPLPDLARLGYKSAGATGVRARQHHTAHAPLATGSNASVGEGGRGEGIGEGPGVESIAARSEKQRAAEVKGTQTAENHQGNAKWEARERGGCKEGGDGNGCSGLGMIKYWNPSQCNSVKDRPDPQAQSRQLLGACNSNAKSGTGELLATSGSNPPGNKDMTGGMPGGKELLSASGCSKVKGSGLLLQSLPSSSLSRSSDSASPPLPSHGHNSTVCFRVCVCVCVCVCMCVCVCVHVCVCVCV